MPSTDAITRAFLVASDGSSLFNVQSPDSSAPASPSQFLPLWEQYMLPNTIKPVIVLPAPRTARRITHRLPGRRWSRRLAGLDVANPR
ncbi:hypothetical protein V496_01040 [Pseudogymnoascus sp. VKM F-4515 (FW-2607)]|nr:hypothetical protein V496_01040 [Pseudogymnoascus sp. VKM F-4515 (FW-2607)]KFY95930.1 hypothetical protein V498_03008 [Pseudogymnoascus sp. VKM F-4517 (FW-2822)]